jgi:hypothetical protein
VNASAGRRRALRLVEFNLHVARFAHRSWFGALLDGPAPLDERAVSDALFDAGGGAARRAEPAVSDALFDAGGGVARRAEPAVSDALFEPGGGVVARSEPALSRWLLEELGVLREMDWEMDELPKRIWLLDGPALERLALEFALCMHREWLVRVIDAKHLRVLYESVGRDAVRFVIQDVPEGAFHYQAPVVSFGSDAPIDVAAMLTDHGARALLALLQPAWRAVRVRAGLYFDRAKALGDAPSLEPAQSRRALELLCERLIPRRFPQWAWCF